MNLNFLKNDKFLSKSLGKDALAARYLLEHIGAKDPNELIEKMFLVMAVQACVTQIPQLTGENTDEFKAIVELKKLGLNAASKIYDANWDNATQSSVLQAEQFDEEYSEYFEEAGDKIEEDADISRDEQ